MQATEIIVDALGRIQGNFRRVLDGLTLNQLTYRPTHGSNSIAWLLWHLTRVQDHHISDLVNRPQIWIRGGWHTKFDMPADPLNFGMGHGPKEVGELKATAEVLQGYHDATYDQSKEFLSSLDPIDLNTEIDEPQYTPLPTIGVRLTSVISDNTQHVGQAAYLRGLLLRNEVFLKP